MSAAARWKVKNKLRELVPVAIAVRDYDHATYPPFRFILRT